MVRRPEDCIGCLSCVYVCPSRCVDVGEVENLRPFHRIEENVALVERFLQEPAVSRSLSADDWEEARRDVAARLSALAHTVAAALQRSAPGRRVEFSLGANLRAVGDPAMLRWVLSVLLGNAWKSTGTVPRGKIEFEALPAKDGTQGFLVRDNRAGLVPNGGRGLFRAFHRLHATRDFPGPGLAAVRRIIEHHGGGVWAEIDLRQGAAFYFTLPPPGPGSAEKSSGEDQPDSLKG